MQRQPFYYLIWQAFFANLMFCFAAYWLQQIFEPLGWLFLGSVIGELWLGVAGVGAWIEAMVEKQEWRR